MHHTESNTEDEKEHEQVLTYNTMIVVSITCTQYAYDTPPVLDTNAVSPRVSAVSRVRLCPITSN